MDPGDPNAAGNSRKNLRRSVEASLRRLRTDYLDVLWVHAWDYTCPVEEVMRALDDLVAAGTVNHVALSDGPAWVASQANALAGWRGWSPLVALQAEYGCWSAPAIASCCRWPRPSACRSAPGRRWPAASSPVSTPAAPPPWKTASAPPPTRFASARATARSPAPWTASPTSSAPPWLGWRLPGSASTTGASSRSSASAPWSSSRTSSAAWSCGCPAEQLARLDEVSRMELGFPYELLRGSQGQLVYGDQRSSSTASRFTGARPRARRRARRRVR